MSYKTLWVIAAISLAYACFIAYMVVRFPAVAGPTIPAGWAFSVVGLLSGIVAVLMRDYGRRIAELERRLADTAHRTSP